jgi:hypothetical protein
MKFTRELVERRAYELFIARGGESGYALQDWLQAEKDVHAEIDSNKRDKQAQKKLRNGFLALK